MKTKARLSALGTGGAVGAYITVVIGIILLTVDYFEGFATWSYNIPYWFRKPMIPEDVRVIYMDEQSHEILKQPYNKPWNRSLHANLLRYLKKDGARAVVFDVVFSDPSEPANDADFAAAIKEFGSVVLAADHSTVGVGENVKHRQPTLPHQEALLDPAGDDVQIGLTTVEADYDVVVRRHFHGYEGEFLSSMAWVTAEMLKLPVASNPSGKFIDRLINYYGPPATIPGIAFYKVINQDFSTATTDNTLVFNPGYFTNKVVFVGVRTLTKYTGERKDEYAHPFPKWRTSTTFIPGAEVHATMFLNLLRGDWINRVPESVEVLSLIILGMVVGYGFVQLRPIICLITAVTLIAAVSVGAYYLFTTGLTFTNWFVVVGGQIPAATLWSVTFNFYQEAIRRSKLQQSLGMYVSPEMAEDIARNPEMLTQGAKKTEVSVLFSDIANFTTMSEGMDPDALAHLMNNYFEGAVNNCVYATKGTVVKFIGDAIFAIWNAPKLQPDHRLRACRAAILLRDQVTDFDFERKPGQEELEVRTRIGLHTGEAAVGNFGSSRRVDYTAFGENINLSARMEGLNKYLGTTILATGDIFGPIRDILVARYLGKFVLKGFNRNVDVYELLAEQKDAAASQAYRDAFAAALDAFHQRDWDGAEAGFKRVMAIKPGDGPSKFYLKHLPDFRESPPDPDWEGEIELKEK